MRVAVTAHDDAVLRSLRARVEALRNLSPVLKDVAGEVDRMTATSLATSRRVDGLPFPDLAESTKIGRLQSRKKMWRGVMKGKKSRGKALRGALRVGNYSEWERIRREQRARLDAVLDEANFKPLVDTGRGARSARAVAIGNGVRFSVVAYMAPHITGGKDRRPPQRNFSVFRRIGEAWELMPQISDYIKARLDRALQIKGGVP